MVSLKILLPVTVSAWECWKELWRQQSAPPTCWTGTGGAALTKGRGSVQGGSFEPLRVALLPVWQSTMKSTKPTVWTNGRAVTFLQMFANRQMKGSAARSGWCVEITDLTVVQVVLTKDCLFFSLQSWGLNKSKINFKNFNARIFSRNSLNSWERSCWRDKNAQQSL